MSLLKTIRRSLIPIFVLASPVLGWVEAEELESLWAEPQSLKPASMQAAKHEVAGGEALSMAAGDLDGDGVRDLFLGTKSGAVLLHRGNTDALFPNSSAALQRKKEGTFTSEPFFSSKILAQLPLLPNYLGVADFDADGHLDLVAAARDGIELVWLRGNGRGELEPGGRIPLSGVIETLLIADVNRRDGLDDVIVAIRDSIGSRVLVFESPEGALSGLEPEIFEVSGTVTALATGRLDGDPFTDIAVAAGTQLMLIRGRDRKLSFAPPKGQEVLEPVIEFRETPTAAVRLATGRFVNKTTGLQDLAVLLEDGTVLVLQADPLLPIERWPVSSVLDSSLRLVEKQESSPPILKTMPAQGKNQLLVLGESATLLQLDEEPSIKRLSTLNVKHPLAALLLRLDRDAMPDIVLLGKGKNVPQVAYSEKILATFTVDSVGDASDVNPGDGSCSDGANCTLRAAIEETNALAGADVITFAIGSGVQTIQPATPLPQAGYPLRSSDHYML